MRTGMHVRGYESTAPRLMDFDGETWMLAWAKAPAYTRSLIMEQNPPRPMRRNFFQDRRDALIRTQRMEARA